jgi:hypothetical protein
VANVFAGFRKLWRFLGGTLLFGLLFLGLMIPAVVIGILAALLWSSSQEAGIVLVVVCGVAALGGIVWWALRQRKHTGLLWGLSSVGLFLGWQAAAVLAVTTMAIHLPLRILGRILPKLRVPPSVWLAGLTLLWILFWARLVSWGRLG